MHRKGTYMSTILKGAPVVAAMNEANAARCAALREKGVVPTLADEVYQSVASRLRA